MGFLKRLRLMLAMAVVAIFGANGSVVAAPTPYTVTPGAVGEPGAPFTATFIDFSYTALVDQQANGQFVETGTGFFGTFRHPGITDVLGGGDTGLGVNYDLYFTFSATGQATPNGAGGLDVTFTSFTATLFVDGLRDTDCALIGGGTTACGAAGLNIGVGAPPDQTVGVTGNAEDIPVGLGTLIIGSAHVFPGLAAGDFDVLLAFEPIGGFFSGPVFIGITVGDVSGVNSVVQGFAPGAFTDGRIDGSGNLFFEAAVPEPSALLLFGSGLVGLAAIIRRRIKK